MEQSMGITQSIPELQANVEERIIKICRIPGGELMIKTQKPVERKREGRVVFVPPNWSSRTYTTRREDFDLPIRMKTYQIPFNISPEKTPGWLIFRIMGLDSIYKSNHIQVARDYAVDAFHREQAYTCYWQPKLGEFHILVPVRDDQSLNCGGNITRMVSLLAQRFGKLPRFPVKIDVFFFPQEEEDDIWNYFFFRHSQGKQDAIQKGFDPNKSSDDFYAVHGILIKRRETAHSSNNDKNQIYYKVSLETYALDFGNINPTNTLNDYLLSSVVDTHWNLQEPNEFPQKRHPRKTRAE